MSLNAFEDSARASAGKAISLFLAGDRPRPAPQGSLAWEYAIFSLDEVFVDSGSGLLLVRVRGDEDCALHDAKAVYRKQVRGQRLANNRILRALELSGGWHSTIAPHFSAMIERQGIAVILERSIFQGCGGNGLPFTRPT